MTFYAPCSWLQFRWASLSQFTIQIGWNPVYIGTDWLPHTKVHYITRLNYSSDLNADVLFVSLQSKYITKKCEDLISANQEQRERKKRKSDKKKGSEGEQAEARPGDDDAGEEEWSGLSQKIHSPTEDVCCSCFWLTMLVWDVHQFSLGKSYPVWKKERKIWWGEGSFKKMAQGSCVVCVGLWHSFRSAGVFTLIINV